MTSKRASVLIVEDEGVVAEDMQQTLDDFGYDAYAIATSADDAIQRATERCPDVVLMDIRIKGERDGIETARILHERFRVPVVFVTAHADDATIQRAKTTEPYGYLTKPIRSADLRSAIEIALYRSEMERRLRERERWFSATLHSVADAVVTVDLAGNITFVNEQAEKLIGLTAAEVTGRAARDVMQLLDDQYARIASPLDQAIKDSRSAVVVEAGLLNASTGTIQLISDSAAPVVDEGRTLGAVMVFRDITEQKKLHKQLELADRLASLGTMAAGVAHEVNNPLTVVVSNAGIAGDDLELVRAELDAAGVGLSAALRERLDEIGQAISDVASAGARIGRIVSDLRSFSRPSPTSSRTADVVQALHWAVRSVAHELRLRARIVTDIDAVPSVVGDDVRLGQVFVNLLLNAAQAIAPGNAENNEVRLSAKMAADGKVCVEVSDTGAGIPDDVRPHIFEPFFTTKPVGVGTGLGLSICHGIVASMGGVMEVTSAVGKGTTIRVLLSEAPSEPASAEPAEGVPDQAPVHGRILAIDDEPMVLRAIQRMLRDHEVVCVESAAEALAMIDRGERFDLIFSDLMMPVMTGMDLFEELLGRRAPELARSVVFITGGAVTSRSEDFIRSVPNEWIEKPFAGAALRSLVNRRLAKPSS